MLQYYPDPNCTDRRRRALAAATWPTPSTSTRTCSGTGSARSITTSAATTAPSSAGARTSATRSATPRAIRSGPAQDGQLPLSAPTARCVGDWVHIFGGGTVFNLRGGYTYYLEWSQSQDSLGFDATQLGWPASLVVAAAGGRRSAACSRASTMADFVSLSRGFGPNTNRNYSIQPNISIDPRRAQHPQRPRPALDQRLQRELRQRRRPRRSSTRSSRAAR